MKENPNGMKVRARKGTYALDQIYPRIKDTIMNHIPQLLLNALVSIPKRRGHRIQRHTTKWYKVLHHALAPNLLIQLLDMVLQVQIEHIVRPIRLKDFEALRVFRRAKERYGAADMRFQFQEVAEVVVLKDSSLQLAPVHGCKRAKTAIDGHVIGCEDCFVPGNICDWLEIYKGRARSKKFFRRVSIMAVCEVSKAECDGDDGVDFCFILGFEAKVSYLEQACLDGHPIPVCDADEYELEIHVADVFGAGAEVAHAGVGSVGCVEVADVVVECS